MLADTYASLLTICSGTINNTSKMKDRYSPNIEQPSSPEMWDLAITEQREEWLEGIKHGQLARERQAFSNIDFLLDTSVEFITIS